MTTRAEKYKKEILEKLKKQYESRGFKDAPFSTEINMIFSQVDELQSTITNKDAEILRLRSLLKEVKEGFENDIFGVLPNGNEAFGYDEGLVMGGEFLTALMEKLKQEGV